MSEQTTVEQVLVVPTLLFHEIGHFQGFQEQIEPYLKTLLDSSYTSYRPRNEMEEDPGFKQLIPYCIFVHEGKIFNYRRGSTQGESRLHSKRSIGVGGHICTDDLEGEQHAYFEGMKREIEEEIHLDCGYEETCLGMINDDETEVGKVHLGIVHQFNLEQAKVSPREASMIDAGFSTPEELLSERDQFETWSQICLDALFKHS